ncbi:hypothetical protein AALO_G00146140, partial [Alosa alosa]
PVWPLVGLCVVSSSRNSSHVCVSSSGLSSRQSSTIRVTARSQNSSGSERVCVCVPPSPCSAVVILPLRSETTLPHTRPHPGQPPGCVCVCVRSMTAESQHIKNTCN